MDKLWKLIGARVVDACECDDCCDRLIYGPNARQVRDTTGHHVNADEFWLNPAGVVATCECGWRDFWVNYHAHLNDVAPLVTAYS